MNYIVTLLLLLGTLLNAQHTFTDEVYCDESGSTIKIESPFSGVPPRGYFPLSVTVENKQSRPENWNLSVTSTDGYMYSLSRSNRMSSAYAISCPPNEVTTQHFLVPVITVLDYNRYQNNASVTITAINNEGREYEPKLETTLNKTIPALIMSERLHRQNGSILSSEFNTAVSKSRGKQMDFDSHFLPKTLPADWRAYTGFDVLMLTLDDWAEMNNSVQRAIIEWSKMGGELIVYKSFNEEVNLVNVGLPQIGAHQWGRVRVREMDDGMKIPPESFLKYIKKSERANIDIVENYRNRWALKNKFGNRDFDIKWLIIILIVFAIFVGPLNLFVFAKEGRRHRLFFTTPLISLITTLILFLVIYLKDGVGGKGITQSLVEIDKASNSLYGSQEQISRTGMLLKSHFEVDSPLVIDPLVLNRSNYWARVRSGNNGGKCQYKASVISPSKTSFAGDWYLSRTETAHLIHYKKPFRQGVEIVNKKRADFSLIFSRFSIG